MAASDFSPFIAAYGWNTAGPEIRVRIGTTGSSGGSTLTGPQIIALIDATLGSTDWQADKFVAFGPTLPDPTTYIALAGTAMFTKNDDTDTVAIGNYITDGTSWILPNAGTATDNSVGYGAVLPDPTTYIGTAGVATFTKTDDTDGVSIGNYITDGSSWILPHDNS